MATRLYAEHTGHGMLFGAIESQEAADWLCNAFRKRGIPATTTPFSLPGDFRVFLPGLTMDEFTAIARELDIVFRGPKA